MAYPGEKRNKEYLDYVEEMSAKGETPLSMEEWAKKRKEEMAQGKMTTALSNY